MKENIIPIVMISDSNFLMQTSVAIASMIKNKNPETQYEIYVVLAECTCEEAIKLKQMSQNNCNVNLLEASLDRYKGIKQLAHISIACLLKFEICELVPWYDKLLYLDGDIVVREDLSQLFSHDVGDNYAAGVKELYCIEKDDGCINAGIMLFNAKKMRDDGMKDKLIEKRLELGDRASMDQQTYNMMIKNQVSFLSNRYNCMIGKLIDEKQYANSISAINALYHEDYKNVKDIIDQAVIIHYATGNKPWKFTFAPGAKEWYQYYLLSPYRSPDFRMYGKWGYRMRNFREAYEKNGVKGVLLHVVSKVKRMLGIKDEKTIDWD